jgi:hypothetical protein
VAVAESTLDVSNGQLEALAEREASLQRQADLIGRRLPQLVEALAVARRAFSTAAGELRTSLRAEALATAVRRRDELARGLTGQALADLLAAGLLGDALAVAGSRDATAAEALALAEVPALATPAPPAGPLPDAFRVPVWASPPPEWPRPAAAASTTPAGSVALPEAATRGWSAVSEADAEKARADQEKMRLVAEHAAAQRARQQAEADADGGEGGAGRGHGAGCG